MKDFDSVFGEWQAAQEIQREFSSVYLGLVEPIKLAKREGRLEDALALCLKAIDATEAESKAMREIGRKGGVAPWYYEQAAIIYRKLKKPKKELAILRRCVSKNRSVSVRPGRIGERLEKLEAKMKKGTKM